MTIGTDTLAQDNFNRSNGNLAGTTMSDGVNTWTALSGTPTIASNKQSGNGIGRVTGNSNFADANYSVQAEQYMKGDVSYASDGVNGEIRLLARIVDANNYYVGLASSNGGSNGALTLKIQKYVSGSPTDIITFAADDDGYTTWRFDVDGTSLKLFGDGSQLLSTTDSTYTAIGYAGIASTGPIGTFSSDNFIVKGTAVGGGGTESVGSSSGTGSAAGVGSSEARSVASSAGTGAASGVGSFSEPGSSVGSAAGVGAATGAGASEFRSVGSASGVGSATAYWASGTTLTNPGAINVVYNGWTATVDVL